MHYPYRIPYKGGKEKIAEQLIQEMIAIKPNAKVFIDLFGGGGAMSFMARQFGLQVVYNDYDKPLADFMGFLMERVASGQRGQYGLLPDEYYTFVTRDDFFKQIDLTTPYSEFCRCIYSFGNARRTYIFAPDAERLKHLLHNGVVFNDADALRSVHPDLTISHAATVYQRRIEVIGKVKALTGRCDLQQLKRLQQLERLQQLKRLQQLERLQAAPPILTITNQSYEAVAINYPDDEVIIYCDPPYIGTNKYRLAFNHDHFYTWLRGHSHTIFISEYVMPNDFQQVAAIEKRCTLSATNNNRIVSDNLYSNHKVTKKIGQLTLL